MNPASAMLIMAQGGGGSYPYVVSKSDGVYDTSTSPPSSVIAVSPSRTMQVVNSSYRITDRSKGTVVNGTISDLNHSPGRYLTDPQVMWDPATSRFYYSFLENNGTTGPDNGIGWGFSKTATPNSAADFCSYFYDNTYGSVDFPDRPAMGDTKNFLMWGSLRISLSTNYFVGSDLNWIAKPATGTSCPAQSTFKNGVTHLLNKDSSTLQYPYLAYPYYPVPARQADASTSSWIVAPPTYVSGNYLTLIQANELNGNLSLSAPQNLTVPTYSYPPAVPQAGKTMSGNPAPPLEANLHIDQVNMSYDPRVGHNALWTSDTIAGGAGSAVRWYEINPVANTLDQVGTISDPNLYYFNSSISSDRAVNGTAAKYGRAMAITFDSSSSTTYPAIWYMAKEGASTAFAPVLIKQSVGPNIDFSCFEPNVTTCRYGDYSGSAPDPSLATSRNTYGNVWITNEWNLPSINDASVVWQTEVARIGMY